MTTSAQIAALSRLLRIPPRRVIAQAVEFDLCCGHPPVVTEYRIAGSMEPRNED